MRGSPLLQLLGLVIALVLLANGDSGSEFGCRNVERETG
jgi:hypothetical protein